MGSNGSMQNVGWPNSVSPGIGAFRIDVPSDWSAIEPAGGLIAFLAPPRDDFRVNLVVFGERVPSDKELGELAEEALLGAGATNIVPIGEDGAESEEQLPSAARQTDLQLEGRWVRQIAVTTEGPDRSPTGVRSVYALVGSCLTDRAEVDAQVLTEMISSFTVTAEQPVAAQQVP
ncbi:hypothetical protein [Pseudonocardia acaciae]|uniref:hypothetical protein n=1 Tax=Pseudonocardia acaciae TaxID=551276 RepID=UPI00048ECC71|nr:hypothetical protein [Pseudonocardia acaciae]